LGATSDIGVIDREQRFYPMSVEVTVVEGCVMESNWVVDNDIREGGAFFCFFGGPGRRGAHKVPSAITITRGQLLGLFIHSIFLQISIWNWF
jgi:hypothetical protein